MKDNSVKFGRSPCESWATISYRPVTVEGIPQWNIGKTAEHEQRVWFKEEKMNWLINEILEKQSA